MRILFSGFILFLCFWTTSFAQLSVDSLNALYAQAWKYSLAADPLKPVQPEDNGLPNMSKDAIAHREFYWIGVQKKLMKADTTILQGDDRINLDVFKYLVDDNVASYQYKTHLMPFTAEGGFHTEFGFLPLSSPFGTASDYYNYLEKLKDFESYVDQHIGLLREAIAAGYTMPAAIMKDFDKTAEAYVTTETEQSIFYKPFLNMPATIFNAEDLRKKGYTLIEKNVIPAYRKLAEFLKEEYIPACKATIAATELPNGKEYYAQRVRYYTTLDMTPEEVFALGQQEVTRIHNEMLLIADSLGYKGRFKEFLEFLRTGKQFYADTPDELLAHASYICKRIEGRLPEYFGTLQRLPYGVEPVPAEIAPRYTGGRYSPGSLKDHRAGAYWVNTYKLESRPLYLLPALTLHEAVPGHHLQISLAEEANLNREKPLPDHRNTYISAYGEGWALYTEWLGKEMGIYRDPYEKFGALTYEMWRACRLVVDPGMHAFGWSREQARDFMAEHTALSLHEIHTEIDRYIGWPGQAVSYKIGELFIRRLRKEEEATLGEKFDLRVFHDKVLETGSVPLPVLGRVLKEEMVKMKKFYD